MCPPGAAAAKVSTPHGRDTPKLSKASSGGLCVGEGPETSESDSNRRCPSSVPGIKGIPAQITHKKSYHGPRSEAGFAQIPAVIVLCSPEASHGLCTPPGPGVPPLRQYLRNQLKNLRTRSLREFSFSPLLIGGEDSGRKASAFITESRRGGRFQGQGEPDLR